MKTIRIVLLVILSISLFLFSSCGKGDNNNHFTGIIEGETFTVSSPVSEKLITLIVYEGEEIKNGQLIGMLDTTALNLQKESLTAKIEQMKWQGKELAVKISQVSDVYKHSVDKYNKNLKLKKNEAVPGQLVIDLKLQVDKWEKEKQALSAKTQYVKSGIRNLKQQILLIQNKIEKAILLSPGNGFADKIYYEKGEYVPPMSPIVDLVNLEKVWCYIYVSENTLPILSPGQEISGTINSSETVFAGKIQHINQKAEFTPKEILTPDNRQALVYAVKVSFENKDKILKIGMPIDVFLK